MQQISLVWRMPVSIYASNVQKHLGLAYNAFFKNNPAIGENIKSTFHKLFKDTAHSTVFIVTL